jgi:hypothetical protein
MLLTRNGRDATFQALIIHRYIFRHISFCRPVHRRLEGEAISSAVDIVPVRGVIARTAMSFTMCLSKVERSTEAE